MLNDTLAGGSAPAGDAGSLIKDTTTAGFRQDVDRRVDASDRCWSISGRPGAARASS